MGQQGRRYKFSNCMQRSETESAVASEGSLRARLYVTETGDHPIQEMRSDIEPGSHADIDIDRERSDMACTLLGRLSEWNAFDLSNTWPTASDDLQALNRFKIRGTTREY